MSEMIYRAHAVDKYETLRNSTKRKLREEAERLEVSLVALERGATHVTAEYVDRTRAALLRLVADLDDKYDVYDPATVAAEEALYARRAVVSAAIAADNADRDSPRG